MSLAPGKPLSGGMVSAAVNRDSGESKESLSAPPSPVQRDPAAVTGVQGTQGALGDAVLRFLRIRKGGPRYDPDAIATQPSLWDSDSSEEYQKLYIHPEWENKDAFDPAFRWTVREERQARRKVDLKIMLWVCVMFSALSIDRANIGNATSDNLLNDIGITQADYNLGITISKVGFLFAELPSQLISKRIGPDRWIPIQICIFSFISAMQFFLNGRSSFLATRFLIAMFQGGFIPDTILYLSYWYSSTALPIRLAFYWMSAVFVDIIIGFLAVGLLSMRGILGRQGWAWLFLIEGLITFVIGLASFLFMPQSPARTKSWWNKKGYFTDKEVKIIVNSVIRDDPQKGGMFNRQGITVKQIWHCAKDYDMWPLYALGLLFGLPKYPVDQYLQISFRGLGFNVIQTNLLSIPKSIGSAITILLITAVSELVNNRSFVAMAEDAWLLPCFIALISLADPISPWAYFAIATVLLSFPYTHPIQVAWTSRNAGSVQNRTISAARFFAKIPHLGYSLTSSIYNMFVQVSAMIGANIYQKSDSPRYFKANKGLLVVCLWMCFVQYPFTYFYYRWRNQSKARKWDAMSAEEQDRYLKTTTDDGNKRLDFRFAT